MRNPLFDLLRILLTVLVVNVHIRIITAVKPNFLEPLVWYAVPLFIVMSFYFYNNTGLLPVRIRRLFLPLVFWSAVGFAVHPDLINLKNVLLQIATGHVVNTPLYYLVLLIWFTLLVRLIYNNRWSKWVFGSIAISAFLLEYTGVNFKFFLPQITVVEKSYGRFIELVKFVPVGLYAAYLNKIKNKLFFLLCSLTFLIAAFASGFIVKPPDFHFSGFDIFFGTIAAFSFLIWISGSKLGSRLSNTIHFLGRYSFGVYLVHYLLIEITLKLFSLSKTLLADNQMIFLFLFLILSYIICFAFDFLTFKKLSFLVT